MKLSSRGEYAVREVLDMALRYEEGTTQVSNTIFADLCTRSWRVASGHPPRDMCHI